MSERMIEQRRAQLLAQNTASSGGGTAPTLQQQNGISAIPATPRQAAAQAMRSEDARMSRFLRLLQETRDDGQPGEAVFGPTVPTSLSRREIHRQGVGFCDTAVAAIASAAADRFLASVLQQSIPCRDQRLKGTEVARQAARERKSFRLKHEKGLVDRRRRKAQEASKRDHANRAAIRTADEMDSNTNSNGATTNTAKRKAPDDDDEDNNNNTNNDDKAKKAKTSNGMKQQQQTATKAPDIDYDSIDEEDKRYIEHYEGYNDDEEDLKSDDDEEDEDEALILSDIARPLRAWGFHVDGKLASDIFGSVVEHTAVVYDGESDVGLVSAAAEASSLSYNGHLPQANGDVPNRDNNVAETGATMGNLNTMNASSSVAESPKKTTPKSGDVVNSTAATTTKSPSTGATTS